MKIIKAMAYLALLLGLVVILGESILYFKGYSLAYYQESDKSLEMVPPELVPLHRRTGWGFERWHFPSAENTAVTENVGPDGLRVSREGPKSKSCRRVALVGCSLTFGLGVADGDTFVYRLNSMFPNTVFDNYGVSGFGTYQCLLEMQDLIRRRQNYDLICYPAFTLHLNRNLEKAVMGFLGKNQPFLVPPRVDINSRGIIAYHSAEDLLWPLERHSLLVNFGKRLYYARNGDNVSTQGRHSKEHLERQRLAFYFLVEEMARQAQEANIQFALLSLDGQIDKIYQNQLAQHRRQGDIEAELVQVCKFDYNDPANHIGQRVDQHPNEKVHDSWAQEIAKWLRAKGYN